MEKKLILVTSPPACGKTYVAKALAKNLKHVVYLDKDTLILCQLMQQRRVGRALNLAARAEDQTGTGRCDLRGKKPAVGIALTMGIGFRAKRCFFKMVCPRQIRMQIRI